MSIRPDLGQIPRYIPGKPAAPTAIKLSSNETTQPPLPAAVAAMQEEAARAHRYPDMGALELRTEIAAHLGCGLNQVAVGAGSSALLQQLTVATAGPGQHVVYPWRSFEAYPIFVRVAGADPVPVPLTPTGEHDFAALAAAVTEKTTLVFLCNPNNPTGTTFSAAQFEQFMAQLPSHVTVALDEAYIEFNRDSAVPYAVSAIARYPNLVVMRTFSKAYALAGARLGYAFGNEALIDAINAVGVPFQANRMAQAGAVASLRAKRELKERIEETVKQRERVIAELGLGPSQANFVWLPTERSAEIAAQLAERGIIVRAFPEGVRITITDEKETDALLGAWSGDGGI